MAEDPERWGRCGGVDTGGEPPSDEGNCGENVENSAVVDAEEEDEEVAGARSVGGDGGGDGLIVSRLFLDLDWDTFRTWNLHSTCQQRCGSECRYGS